MYPTEGAYFKGEDGEVIFVQVAYSIWKHPEDEANKILPLKYRVYFGGNDHIGKEVVSSKLYKLTPRTGYTQSGSAHVVPVPKAVNKPEVFEGWRYVKQAEVDLNLAKVVKDQITNENMFGYMACFLSHQVAEKALEGLVLGLWGKMDRGKDHSWHKLKTRIRESEVDGITQDGLIGHVAKLEEYYLDTRYPDVDKWKGLDTIPSDHYDLKIAGAAITAAEAVFELVKTKMPPES
jgi:HEPN domain-containing protein